MKPALSSAAAVVAALSIVFFPSEAHLSGSSTVVATGKFFRVELESVRKRFHNTDDESAWHRDWKRDNQPVVDRIKSAIEAKLPKAMGDGKWPLVELRADLEEVLDDIADDPSQERIYKSGKPFAYRYRMGGPEIIVAFAKLPPPPMRKAIRDGLQAMLPK